MTWKGLQKEVFTAYFKALFHHLPRGTKAIHENPQLCQSVCCEKLQLGTGNLPNASDKCYYMICIQDNNLQFDYTLQNMWTPCVISKNYLPFFQDPKALWNHHQKTRFLMTDCGKEVGLNVHWFYCEVNRWEISPSLVIVLSDAAWGQGHLAPQTEIHILIHPYP